MVVSASGKRKEKGSGRSISRRVKTVEQWENDNDDDDEEEEEEQEEEEEGLEKSDEKKQPRKKWISFWRKTLTFMCTAFLIIFRSRIGGASGATDEAHTGGVSPSLTSLSPTLMAINGDAPSKYQKQTSCQAHVCWRTTSNNRQLSCRMLLPSACLKKPYFSSFCLHAVFSNRSVLCFKVPVTYLFV